MTAGDTEVEGGYAGPVGANAEKAVEPLSGV